ncbi:MAG: hypothetical protein Q7T88_00680 [Methylotenera sp.]|nr:hypothetical protein [Methylotenera sp.]
MRKIILMLTLGIFSNFTFAGWTEIGSSNGDTVYADSSTSSRNGDAVKIWLLHDLVTGKINQGNHYLSEKRLNEYDCKTEEVRSHAHFFFSENMGGGDTVPSVEEFSYWKLVEPASVDYSSLKLACNRLDEILSFGKGLLIQMFH